MNGNNRDASEYIRTKVNNNNIIKYDKNSDINNNDKTSIKNGKISRKVETAENK